MKAFPTHGTMGEVVQEGMDLRDYFAAKAITTEEWRFYASSAPTQAAIKDAAKRCYQIADAMMKARAQ